MKAFNKRLLNKMALAAVVVPLAIGSMSAFSAGGPGSKANHLNGRECQVRGERGMFRALDLNSAQRDKIRALRQKEREKMHAQRVSQLKEMHQLHTEKNKLVLAKNFNPKAAHLLAQKMVNEQAKIRAERQIERHVEKMQMQHDMMRILTPAQQVKWGELMKQQFKNDCGPHYGKGQHRDGGFHDGRKAPRL